MKRMLSLVICVVALTGTANGETVQTAERTFGLKHRDGTVELYKVRWTASRDMAVTEHGGPAKPLEGKFFDDRRCEWNINGAITRVVALVTRSGKEFIHAEKTKVFNSDFRNEGTSFDILTLQPGNCNQTAARRNSDYGDVQRVLLASLGPTVAADFEVVKQEYRTDGAVLEVQ